MSAHIIGQPKPPKRGATFGDVPRGTSFIDSEGERWMYPLEFDTGECVSWVTGKWRLFARFEPVTPLCAEPVEPEPDPGVTEWIKLPPGFFQEPSSDAEIMFQSQHGAVRLTDGDVQHLASTTPCRPVAASVVVHEEPGTWVLDAESSGRTPMANVVDPSDETIVVSSEDAEHIVAELSAWLYSLAQRDAEREEDERANRVVDAAMSRALLTQTMTPLEPAEDRSKPAPGYWVVCIDLGSDKHWIANGKGWSDYWYLEESQAIAATWERHDAEQAGEGGSDE